mmetsp:Transcript_24290/g.34786  ORF Transcript_24290/g.34786 Transcript_24290/m.34786 type:complete len:219 (+) Transcript_24290:191-847(+)
MSKTFTEELRAAAGDQWNRVINHRFTTELARGDIDRNVLKKYLIQDHRFLDAFVVLLASAIAKARSLDDRIPGCQFLGLITGKENTYFERSFEVLGCGKEERAKIPDQEVTKGFVSLMSEVSSEGTLGEILSVLVVAEWSYLSWGEKVLPITNRDDFLTYEWVDLHSGDYFNEVVAYLRGLLDKEGTLIDDEGKEKCKAAFLRAIQLEEDFFEMAYAA